MGDGIFIIQHYLRLSVRYRSARGISTIRSKKASIATAPYAPIVSAIVSANRNENACRRVSTIAASNHTFSEVTCHRMTAAVAKKRGMKKTGMDQLLIN